MLESMTFRFLNETYPVASPPWQANASALWNYNLHYFDDLNAAGAASRGELHREAIARWVADNPPGVGVGWEPYPASLRIVNWIKWGLGGGALSAEANYSLATQARCVRSQLEYHLLGNHLFANAKALVFAGVYFEGSEAEAWLERGLAILEREIPEQILPDGGQYERSPMYHALALEDVIDLANVAAAFPGAIPDRWQSLAQSWPALARRMNAWLRAMCHPDGEIAFFNDAAIGTAPSPEELVRYLADVTHGSAAGTTAAGSETRLVHLLESGYIRMDEPGSSVLVDVAPVGPDHLPGHAHADTLSFEWSVFGARVIVNTGTSRYDVGPERDKERGTAAHSTVVVDGQDSSEVWAGFRVARRARPFDLVLEGQGEEMRVACSHDGYRRLAGRPIHRRTWLLRPGLLRVEDQVAGGSHNAVARFHLHPSIAIAGDGRAGKFRLPGGQSIRWRALQGAGRIEPSMYHPEFGVAVPSHCLAVELADGRQGCIEYAW